MHRKLTVLSLFLILAAPARADSLTDAVNAQRALYGLHALAHDDGLAGWAAANNARGFGHYVLGPAVLQNAAWGMPSVSHVVNAWMGSPGHRAAMLSRTVTACGGAFNGSVWTLNFGYATPMVLAAEAQPQPDVRRIHLEIEKLTLEIKRLEAELAKAEPPAPPAPPKNPPPVAYPTPQAPPSAPPPVAYVPPPCYPVAYVCYQPRPCYQPVYYVQQTCYQPCYQPIQYRRGCCLFRCFQRRSCY